MPTGQNYQGRDGALRLLDKSQSGAGASGTPYGLQAYFEQMDLTITFPARPDEIVRLDRERFTSDAHLQLGSEEPLFNPIDISFAFRMSSQHQDALLEFVGTKYMGLQGTNTTAWSVKGTPAAGLTSTKGRALSGDGLYGGGRIDGKGSAVVLPPFADKKKVCVDLETTWFERDGTNRFGFRVTELFFEPSQQRVAEAADGLTVTLTGRCYGGVQPITSFSRAMDVLTSQLFS
jgi:hypothetical protein